MKKKSSSKKRTGKTYLLYARVSPKGSTWDAEETSIGVQFQEMKDYFQVRDPSATFIEVFDEMKSGKDLNRPGIQRIIADLDSQSDEWDCLVVWHLDRLTRSLNDALPLFKKIRNADKGLISIRQNIDMFSAGGRFMIHMFISIAEYEREMTSERVSAKMHGIAQQGKIPWGNIPFGYRRKAGVKNTVEIDPDKAPVVRDLFEMFLRGQLTFENVRKKYGDMFKYRTQIYKILRCKMYTGEFDYDGDTYKSEHEAIIGKEMFEKVQQMLPQGEGNKRPRPSRQKYPYLLLGMIRCHCGKHMTSYSASSRGNSFYYYKCTDPLCKNAVSAPQLDDAVVLEIRKLIFNEDTLKNLYRHFLEQLAEERAANLPQVKKLNEQIAELRTKRDRISEMFTDGIVTADNMEYWNGELKRHSEALSKAEESLVAAKTNYTDDPPEGFFEEFDESMKQWAKSIEVKPDDDATKRLLVGMMVQDVICAQKNQFKLNLVLSKRIKWWATRNLIITVLINVGELKNKKAKRGLGVRAWL